MNRCLIVGAGDFFPRCRPNPLPGDLLIAADGGYKYLKELNLRPDLLVADFDSLTAEAPADIPVMRFKSEKDDTDMGIAISEGVRRGYSRFFLYGGTGGRADHTFANYQALISLARRGMRGYLMDEHCVVTAVCDAALHLNPLPSGTVSVFAADSRCEDVSITGLKYEVDHAPLTNDYPLGVSNELTGRPAVISVGKGTLLVFCPAEAISE